MTPAAPPSAAPPGHSCRVFAAADIYVSMGVNMGDGLAPPDEVEPGDIYALDEDARALPLVLSRAAPGHETQVAPGSPLGRPGEQVRIVARHVLMSPDGDRVELLLLQLAQGLYVLPLSPVIARTGYTLLAAEEAPADVQLGELICVSFARGTMITLASGRQMPIEQLRPGESILTRDHGPQPLRLLGRATLRAVGAFAPVIITAGTLGNSGDLIVAQHHRMFLYQRRRMPGITSSELLVQARHLADGEKVFIREGGVTDWFSLVFDRHEIIYAEGIPAESLMVNDATLGRLPAELSAEVARTFPGLAHVQHFGTEAGRQFLENLGPEQLFHRPRMAAAPPLGAKPPAKPRPTED